MGGETSIWYDLWLLEGKLIDICDYSFCYWELVCCWYREWGGLAFEKWRTQFSLATNSAATRSLYCCTHNTDTWKWSLSESGLLTFSSCWEGIRTAGQVFALHKMVWFHNHSPKMSMCLVRALKVIIDSDICALCKENQKLWSIYFFECAYSSYLWMLCRLKLGITSPAMGNLQAKATLLQDRFKKDKENILAKTSLADEVWHIWKERNESFIKRRSTRSWYFGACMKISGSCWGFPTGRLPAMMYLFLFFQTEMYL